MAIATYLDLKNAVASWLHRTDLTTVIPTFISLAESRIRHDVRCRAMEATTSGSLSAATVALPTRFAEAIRVKLDDETLSYTTRTSFTSREDWGDSVYTIEGSNFVFPATSGDYVIDYYAWFAAFSADGDTNTLLTNHPDIYLYASLAEAASYLSADPTQWLSRYGVAVQRLKTSEQKAYGGPLVVRVEGSASGYVP